MIDMDAKLIYFLNKKFQKLSDEIQEVKYDLSAGIDNIEKQLSNIDNILGNLTNTIDGFIKFW
ncbi:MAG: hypothetical protein Q7S57_02760 [bacterium]|nr:hypothetical protein [bacterium]